MYDEVWNSIVKGSYNKCIASINGYERLNIKNEVYPALVKKKNSEVMGVIWKNVSSLDVEKLNIFEGDYYSLEKGQAIEKSGKKIQISFYLLKNRYSYILENSTWSKRKFETKGLQLFKNTYFGFKKIT